MWRTFALVLLLLNALYWAWGEGRLLPYGFGPTPQREPQRLAQQIRPEAITILRAFEEQLPPLVVAPEPAICLQSGPMNQAQADAVRALLEASWPPESWVLQEVQAGQS
ncbi:MAG TPA: SPOR domain-containing protein, partial [Rhodoferax sp.]|nr:SPOR domain-containing protein [Rhodoferax sp.]